MPVLDHVRERLALFDFAAEGKESRAHRVIELEVGHHHVEDRLRFAGNRVPNVDRYEQAARGRRDRRGARVFRLRLSQRRIGDRHSKARPERLAQRDGERQAGKAGAADHHVLPLAAAGHLFAFCARIHRFDAAILIYSITCAMRINFDVDQDLATELD